MNKKLSIKGWLFEYKKLLVKMLKKELKNHIIKHEQLINKMKQLHEANGNGRWFIILRRDNKGDFILHQELIKILKIIQ